MTDLWRRIQQLEGTTLYTVARQRAFDILEVTDDQIWYAPQSTGKKRGSSGLPGQRIAIYRISKTWKSPSRFSTKSLMKRFRCMAF